MSESERTYRHPHRRGETEKDAAPGAVCGRNAVRELVRSGRAIDKIFVLRGKREGSVLAIIAQARENKIPVLDADSAKLDSLSGGVNHQGIVALAAEKEYSDVSGILAFAAERGEAPFIVIADGIEDPHNLGALIRCAECAGVHGIILPRRRSAGLTPTVSKTSAGALEHMLVARVSNLAQTVDELKRAGVWVYAADMDGENVYEADLTGAVAIVIGAEGEGVSQLVLKNCDKTLSIPMKGHINSLNASVAAGIMLFQASRARNG